MRKVNRLKGQSTGHFGEEQIEITDSIKKKGIKMFIVKTLISDFMQI